MREILLILLFAGLLYLTLLRPWLGLLVLAVVGTLQPQGYVGGVAADWPLYRITLATLAISMLLSPELRSTPYLRARAMLFLDWRILLLGVLGLLFLNSTLHSLIPAVAWPKLAEIAKVLITSLLALLLLDTVRKQEWFLLTLALCIALVAFKGGYWALTTGSADRVYGPPGSQFTDNNHFAVLAIMGLPLLTLWVRRAGCLSARLVLAGVIGVTIVAVLTSWSRGALLSLGATLALMAVFTDRRLALIPLLVVGAVLLFDLLPEAWFARMQTILGYAGEGSAEGRLGIWREGLDFALRHPLTGSGPNGWLWMGARDWHSAYVEILAEHGFPALAVWMGLLLGTMAGLGRCALAGDTRQAQACAAVLVSLVGYAVGAAFLGLAYWDVYYQLLVLSVLLTRSPCEGVRQPGNRSAPGPCSP